ncbi:MarR family winged helix-turn-helix transcriptional regulator [Promicromonospora citrea]|nr:MarR family winged helix-turn-helix transcriptional regulator [Promicromonospora citrea]
MAERHEGRDVQVDRDLVRLERPLQEGAGGAHARVVEEQVDRRVVEVAIDPEEPPPSMTVMAERLHCNAPNLSFVVKQLVERGYAERATDPHDRRSRVVVLTDEGRQARAEVIAGTLERTPFAVLDGAELRELARLLAKALGPAGGGG